MGNSWLDALATDIKRQCFLLLPFAVASLVLSAQCKKHTMIIHKEKQKALFRCKCMLIKTSDSQGLLFGFILIKKTGGGKVLQCKHAQILKTCRVTLKCTQGYEQSLLEPPSTAYFSTKSEAKKRLLYLSKSLHSTSDASGQWWKLFLWPQRDRK